MGHTVPPRILFNVACAEKGSFYTLQFKGVPIELFGRKCVAHKNLTDKIDLERFRVTDLETGLVVGWGDNYLHSIIHAELKMYADLDNLHSIIESHKKKLKKLGAKLPLNEI